MHVPPRIILGLACSLALLAPACAGPDTSVPQPTTAALTGARSDGSEFRHRNHGGTIRLVTVSLTEVPLATDQRTALEALRKRLIGDMQPVRDAASDLAAVLADGVSSGTVDRAKADAASAALHDATLAERDEMARGLQELHDTLAPDQRAMLIDKMQALWTHWHEDWEGAAAFAEPPPNDMTILSEKLGLTADQVSRIQARFTASMQGVTAEYGPRDVTARAEAFGAAFRADSFNTNTAAPPSAGTFGATRMTRFFEAFAPELSAAQRDALAQMIREHARRHDQP
jgi:Spy/CpxP family protein refolding chaperone